jgi:chromate transport protein ChrA
VLTSLYEFWSDNHWFHAAIRGALAAAVGLLCATSWQLIRPHLKRSCWLRTAVLVSGSVLLSARLGVSPVRVLAIAAVLGFVWRDKETS